MEFIIIIFLILAVILIAPLLLKRLYVPSAIAILLFGAILGPYGLDVIGLMVESFHGSREVMFDTLDYLSSIGLIFLMSLAGMEISPLILKKSLGPITKFTIFSISIPALVGLVIAISFGLSPIVLLLFLAVFISHSVAMVFSMAKELHFSGTKFGITIIGATLVVDVVGLVLLAIAVRIHAGLAETDIEGFPTIYDFISKIGPFNILDNLVVYLIVYIIIFFLFVFGTVKIMEKLSHMVFKRVAFHDIKRVTFVLMALFGIVLIGEFLGIHLIVSSFVGGLAIADSFAMKEDQRILHKKLDALGYGLFVPLFFFILGMRTNLAIFYYETEHIPFILITVIGFIAAKTLGGTLAMKYMGFDIRKSFLGGWFTTPQLSTALAAAMVGEQMGIFPDYIFSTLVILTVVTCIPTPVIGKLLIKRWHVHFHELEAELSDLIYSLEPEPKKPVDLTATYTLDEEEEYTSVAPYSLDSFEEEHHEPTRKGFLVEEDGVDMILHDELMWDDHGPYEKEVKPEEGTKTHLHKHVKRPGFKRGHL